MLPSPSPALLTVPWNRLPMTHGGLPSRVGTRVLLCVCVVSWVGGGGPALGGTVEWLRGGARGACRQVCVVGVAVHGLSLYVGGWSWYAADAGGPRSGRLSRVLSCTVRILMSYVLCRGCGARPVRVGNPPVTPVYVNMSLR